MGEASLFNTMRARINGKCAIVDLRDASSYAGLPIGVST
jgi:hypothetical protein